MLRRWTHLARCLITTAAAGSLLAMATPALAATSPGGAHHAAGAAAPPSTYEAMSASWRTPESGLVLIGKGYDAGGTPYLFQTADAGHSWKRLTMPTALADGTVYQGAGDIVAANWNMTRFEVTRDQGLHWAAIHLTKIPAGASALVDRITIADGRIYALVQLTPKTGPDTIAVYSAAPAADTFVPVPGLSMTSAGPIDYGNITVRGAIVQVVLGNMSTVERYWYTSDGVHFSTAPRPCPLNRIATPVQTFGAAVAALCADAPASVGPGITDMRVWETAHRGGTFQPAGPTTDLGDPQGFTAVSATDMTLINQFQLLGTADSAKTWTVQQTTPNGGFWPYLAFPSASTGFALADTINNAGHNEGILFRTTDGGHTWKPVSLP